MTEILLSFARTGDAIKAEGMLLEAGIPVRVMPLPPAIRAGCGICLRVDPEHLAAARACLQAGGIAAPGLYTRSGPSGKSTYTPLEDDNG